MVKDPATADRSSSIAYQVREELEFRAPKSQTELYFSAITTPGYAAVFGPYSKEKFGVRIDAAGAPRAIGPENWSAARRLTRFDTQVLWEGIIGANKNATYSHKEFAKSGDHLALAMTSANERWIAVFSYDGKQGENTQGSPGIPGRSKEPSVGILYTDVCNVGTGVKVIAITGPFKNRIAGEWFLTAAFVEDRYFFFNTTGPRSAVASGLRLVICKLPTTNDK